MGDVCRRWAPDDASDTPDGGGTITRNEDDNDEERGVVVGGRIEVRVPLALPAGSTARVGSFRPCRRTSGTGRSPIRSVQQQGREHGIQINHDSISYISW